MPQMEIYMAHSGSPEILKSDVGFSMKCFVGSNDLKIDTQARNSK